MGNDLRHMQKDIGQNRSVRYCNLKTRLCKVLGLEWNYDVTGPGDDQGATDDDVIEAVKDAMRFIDFAKVFNVTTNQPTKEIFMSENFGKIQNPIAKNVDGVTYTQIQAGQKRKYGDSYYEFIVTSELTPNEIERICTTKVYQCDLKQSEWLADARSGDQSRTTADMHFRSCYKFEARGDGSYLYTVTEQSTH